MNYGNRQVKLKLNDAIKLSRRGDYLYHPMGFYMEHGQIKPMDGQPIDSSQFDKLYKHLRSNWILETE